ncbi:alpha/beta hydrolase [Microbacteriaceae bacterium K1510]|nr:alpha/beta hydrolase [Microbacteriaceae bacterium K1510]
MTATDYEVEYNNRARVPEHPEIFARWFREGEAYRNASPKLERLSYGPSERQTLDLFPTANDGPATPLMLFIHGGWWRSLEPDQFSQMAKGANAHGVTVAVIGYDLCPTCSIADIVDQVRAAGLYLWRKRRQRFLAVGHSAGAHLASCMLATEWKTLDSTTPNDLVPAAYAISGVFDLAPLTQISVNADLKLTEKTAHELSPLYWHAPTGRVLDAVVGGLESSEFLRQSRTIAEAWRQGMAQTRYEEIAGKNHFDVIDALADPDSAMTKRVVELARQVQAIAL